MYGTGLNTVTQRRRQSGAPTNTVRVTTIAASLACTTNFAAGGALEDHTAPGDARIVSFTCCQYSPKHMMIKSGQSVTFSGDFGFHPFRWACQEGAVVTNAPPSGSTGVFTFNKVGAYNFYCNNHGSASGANMAGSILVVP